MPTIPTLSPQVTTLLARARTLSEGRTTRHEVATLVGDIGRLSEADRQQLFDTFDDVKARAGGPKDKEALEVFLGALKGKPAQLLHSLEKDDGIVDLKDALRLLGELGRDGKITGKERVSVFTMALIAKTTPDARAALMNFSESRAIDIDHVMRGLLARGNIGIDDVRALRVGAGTDPYGCYQLSYWAQTTQASDFAPGGHAALQIAAEETYRHISPHYKEDLELNRGRTPSTRGAQVLDRFSRETLNLPYAVSFHQGRYDVNVQGRVHSFDKPDELGAVLIDAALKQGGHAIDTVKWDPADGGRYVVSKGQAHTAHRYHSELLRQFGYNV